MITVRRTMLSLSVSAVLLAGVVGPASAAIEFPGQPGASIQWLCPVFKLKCR